MKQIPVITLLFFSFSISAQVIISARDVDWPKWENISKKNDTLKNDNAFILNDNLLLNYADHTITRFQEIKIINEDGLKDFNTISLPENIDITQIKSNYTMGRFKNRNIPYVTFYKVIDFSARIIRNNKIIEIPISQDTQKHYWLKYDGERIYDYEYIFNLSDLKEGDVLQYYYKASFKGQYGTDQLYTNDYYPKINAKYEIRLSVENRYAQGNFILNHFIDTINYKKTSIENSLSTLIKHVYEFKNLAAVKYPKNCLAGNSLMHITVKSNENVLKFKFQETGNGYKYIYIPNYTWYYRADTLINKKKNYNKYYSSLRKFLLKFPEATDEKSHSILMSQIVDTLNTYNYILAESIRYGEYSQLNVNSTDKLLKKELLEEYTLEINKNILDEKNIFYYETNIQDRRLGVHSSKYRAHYNYEQNILALPINNNIKYYTQRFNGVKYLPDELPFYLEGTYAVLNPVNVKHSQSPRNNSEIKFNRTPLSTFNENVRTESGIFKINTDSLIIDATIKENLSGQFSTILRHLYNSDIIDSTINLAYYTKCTDKPNSINQKIQLISQAKEFPFKTSYKCNEKIKISPNEINLNNWFSFILKKSDFRHPLNTDYYFDFTYTDSYNIFLEFDKPTTINNSEDFKLLSNNEYFEIVSSIVKQSENQYIISVNTKLKAYVLPKEKFNILTEYLSALDKLNNFKLKISH
jgi:hypothetical protein